MKSLINKIWEYIKMEFNHPSITKPASNDSSKCVPTNTAIATPINSYTANHTASGIWSTALSGFYENDKSYSLDELIAELDVLNTVIDFRKSQSLEINDELFQRRDEILTLLENTDHGQKY